MTERSTSPIDVLVIGAGPTGTALAIDLVRRGLRVRTVSKAAHVFEGSRAKGVQPRTLEVLDDLGTIDDIVTRGCEYPPLGIHLGPLTIRWRMFSKRQPSADVPFPNTWLIPQYDTDGALHARLRALGGSVEFDKELVDLDQDSRSVTATLAVAGGGREHITARYVVGADGGSSKARQLLGIGFVGSTDEQDRIVIADAVVTGLSRDRWHIWPGRRGRFVGACPLPHSDLFQWMIRLRPGEEPARDKDGLTKRIREHTRNPRIELHDIRWTSVFRPNIRLADHYRRGRVFLAGDAAHVHTPAGAQGLNTGIQDAYNLGWKLAQVCAGADDRLLDTYEAERRPIAANVLGLSTRKYAAISALDPSSIRRGKDEQQLAISYFGGPLARADGGHTKTLRPGDRAPDAAFLDASGERVRMFDLLRGTHFTAIATGTAAAQTLARLAWPARGARLARVFVDAVDIGGAGISVADRDHSFRGAYGIAGDALFVIRPDGYIGHIANHGTPGTVQDVLRVMTPSAPVNEPSGRRPSTAHESIE